MLRAPHINLAALTGVVALFFLIFCSEVAAEIRTITATGEYRMGDNDTRTDAKKLALLDAKRLALEQAGTYLESVTEVKNLQVGHDELRAYTAGIVEVTEQATKDVLEGSTHIVRVEVVAKVDTMEAARQVGALRMNVTAKAELSRARDEVERLRQELEAKTRELAATQSGAEVELVTRQRQLLIVRAHVYELTQKALAIYVSLILQDMSTKDEERPIFRRSALNALAHAQSFAKEALGLDPSNALAKSLMVNGLFLEGGWLAEEKSYQAARAKFREAIKLSPQDYMRRARFAMMLSEMGEHDEALSEMRAAITLNPNVPIHYIDLGHILLRKGDMESAAAEFRRAIRLAPDSPFGHFSLSQVLDKLGQKEEAQRERDEGMRLQENIMKAKSFEDMSSKLGLSEIKPPSR